MKQIAIFTNYTQNKKGDYLYQDENLETRVNNFLATLPEKSNPHIHTSLSGEIPIILILVEFTLDA
jgi:hypothetical protein